MNREHKKVFDDFIEMKIRKGAGKQEINSFKWTLPKFLDFLEVKDIELHSIDRKTALEYQGELLESRRKDKKQYSKHTVYSNVIRANIFSDYLVDKGILYTNPFKKLKKIRLQRKLPENLLNESQMAALMGRLADFTAEKNIKRKITRYRVHVIAELMYATGLRIDEVVHLRKRDIDYNRGIVEVRKKEEKGSRVAYLTEYACAVLKLYIEKMRAEIMAEWWDNDLLFGTGTGTKLGKTVSKILAKGAEEAGVKKITSQDFRHALGFHLVRAGCNIRHIQSIMGDKMIRSTEVYMKVACEKLKEMMDKYHPRQWRKRGNG